MRNIIRLIMLTMLLGAGTQANAQSGLLWDMKVSPICSLQPGLKNVENFDSTPYENDYGFICNEDSAFNPLASLFGTESDSLSPLKPMLKNAGFETVYPENNALSSMTASLLLILSFILIPAAAWLIVRICLEGARTGNALATIAKYPVRLFAVLLVTIYLLYGGAIIMYFPTIGIFMANGQIAGKVNSTFEAGRLKNSLEATEKFMLSANTASQIKMAAEEDVTTQALFQFNHPRMTKVQGTFFGSNSLTKDEALEEAVKQGRLTIELNKESKLNFDVTSKLSDIVNAFQLGRRYTLTKKAPYSPEYRDAYGFETVYGSVEIGSNGENVEQQAGGESLNDGTMMNMLRSAQKQSAETLGPQYVPKLGTLKTVIKEQLKAGAIDTTNVSANPAVKTVVDAIRKKYSTAATSIRADTIKYDEIQATMPQTYDVISGVAGATIFAGARGHDMTSDGQLIRAQQDWIRKEIILPLRSAVCTADFEKYTQAADSVARFNALPGEKPMKEFIRITNMLDLDLSCAEIDGEAHRIDVIGSRNRDDAEEDKMEALAGALAKNELDSSIYLGIKDSLADDKDHEGALKYAVWLQVKEGVLGLGLSDVTVSNYLNAQQVKARSLNSSLYFTFKNAGIPNYNFVNLAMLRGTNDLDLSDEELKFKADSFPVLPFNMLMISSVTNVAPSSLLSDQSAESAFSVAKLVGNLLSVESDSIKLLGGMDQGKSMYDGATECKNDPSVCEGNPTVNFETGMRLMGRESIDYANKVMGAYVVAKALKEAKDLVPTVLEATTAGVADSSSVKFFKLAWSAGTAIFTAAIYGTLVIAGGLLPVAYMNYGIGLFCLYFLPIVKIFLMISVIIMFGWEVAILKAIYAPWLLLRALIANDDASSARYLKQFGMKLLKVTLIIPTFVIVYNFLSFMLENFVPKRIIWSILTMGDGSLMAQIVSSVMVSIGLLWIYFSFVKAMKTCHNDILKALTQQENVNDDNTYQKVVAIMTNPQMVNAFQLVLQQGTQALPNAVKNYSDKEKENMRRQFNDIPRNPVVPQSSDGTKKRDSE
ncbi:efflux RND transporter permease subunit [Pseudomonas amygdali]|uniref:efflux RND transporter permease subunit n=1 Tax=Pseudomonas amygdali TaxID=47877 RepID=UPI000EFE350C|nr:efflux RND transporter permease subunit [Pseudomonas amygdali]RMV80715.1 putative Membrane protein [Pseudomonas amygdali pv. sesami]